MKISNPILVSLCLVLLLATGPSALYANTAPVLNQPSDMTVNENGTVDQSITATDADGQPVTFFKTGGPTYMTVTTVVPGTGTSRGNIHLAPGCGDAGTTTGTVSVSDGSLSDSKTLSITVLATCNPPNHPPTANPGGPYSPDCPGANLCFDGGGSSDPDRQPLTYSWDFGDGTASAAGQRVCHSFQKCGTYNVCLTVTDTGSPPLSHTACTTQTIEIRPPQLNLSRKSSAVVNLKVMKGEEVITVTYASPCPLSGDIIGSWKMKYGTSAIAPDLQSSSGTATILTYKNSTLSSLFRSLGSGKTTSVTVTIEGKTGNSQCTVAGSLSFSVQK